MQLAYFSNIKEQIITHLNKATNNVQIAMAWFTNSELYESILECLDRGIKVELILLDNAINWNPYAPDFNEIVRKGGVFRIANTETNTLHHKFCIIDNSVVITGSYNWTYFAENKNLENILITDDLCIIQKYREEFTNLIEKYESVSKVNKLTWSDIEQLQNVNFDEINFEISSIAKSKQLTEHNLIKSKTQVQIVEKRFYPKSKYFISIPVYDNGELDFLNLIEAGGSLPCTSKEFEFYAYPDIWNDLSCVVYCRGSENSNYQEKILDNKLTDILKDLPVSCNSISVKIRVLLNTNGYLHIEIKCQENGKAIELTTTNKNLVDYEAR